MSSQYGSCCQNLCLVKYNKERVFPVHIPEVGSLNLIQEIITSHYYCQDELTEAWCTQKWLFQLIEIRKNGHKCCIPTERFIALLFRIHVNTAVDGRCGAHAQIDLRAAQAPLFHPPCSVWGCDIFHPTEITVFCQYWVLMNNFYMYSMDFSNTFHIYWRGENP